jgi:hypothetical protein
MRVTHPPIRQYRRRQTLPAPMASLLLTCAALLSFGGCSDSPDVTPSFRDATNVAPPVAVVDTVTAPESALGNALSSFVAQSGAALGDEYDTARMDLNGDGIADGLVLLYGADWCGSGGCTLLVFQGTADGGFNMISETSLVNGPIVVSETRTNGWRDIVIPDPAADRNVALEYNGSGYPTEPTGPAARSDAGDTVFEGEIGLF